MWANFWFRLGWVIDGKWYKEAIVFHQTPEIGDFVEVHVRPWLVEGSDDKGRVSRLYGAACHGCLLIAETSCEARNCFSTAPRWWRR